MPQVSVKLETLPDSHIAMLHTYLAFWREHRDVIQHGALMPLEPQNAFPAVLSRTDFKLLIGVFANTVTRLPESLPEKLLIVNATCLKQVVLHSDIDHGSWSFKVVCCTGELFQEGEVSIESGATVLTAPQSGYILLRQTHHRADR